nr:hypothetical protein [Tanacetum cinerariifolium]
MGTSSGLKTWYLAQCGVNNQSVMINMLSGESLIGGANVNSSTDLQSTGSRLEMSTQNVESSLSLNFILSNGIITSIWIGSRCAIWRKSDKERAAAMIQAIDKQLKTRRIMRSLEKFVCGRLYEGDFKMLQ